MRQLVFGRAYAMGKHKQDWSRIQAPVDHADPSQVTAVTDPQDAKYDLYPQSNAAPSKAA